MLEVAPRAAVSRFLDALPQFAPRLRRA